MLTPKTEEEMKALMAVALGRRPADLVVSGAQVVNVYTGEVLAGLSVAVKGRWIAYVGGDTKGMVGPETRVIDAAGRVLIPGLIDAHTHVAWLYSAAEYARHAAPRGTTLAVTEALEPYPVAGGEGVIDFLDSLAGQPVKLLATAPAMVSISTAARGIAEADLDRLLARGDVLGLGESYWQEVLKFPEVYLPAMARTLACGKRLEGHSAGASDRKLNAYLSAGVTSCHEPITAEQALAGLRLGLHVMVREGSIRRDLAAIAELAKTGIDRRRLVLVTDGLSAEDLLSLGHMDYVVQKAIDCGLDPVAAVQMATLNPAEHFGLDHLLGGIAPGRLADMVLVPSLGEIDARVVINDGRVVAEDGRLTVPVRAHRFAERSRRTVNIPAPLSAEDFRIPAPAGADRAVVRVIEMVTDLVTREAHLPLPVAGGDLSLEADDRLAKVAAVDRARQPGKRFVGVIQGFGLRAGAMACSAAWDSSDVVVAGRSDADMAAAVNRIRELQGGAVVCREGRILAELALPVFGLAAETPLKTLRGQARRLSAAAAELGVPFPDPLLSLITLTGAAIPYLRICEQGLVNLKDGQTRGLFVEDQPPAAETAPPRG